MAIIRRFPRSINESSSNDDQVNKSGIRRIGKKMDLLDQKIDGLYRDIYISRPDNKANLDSIVDKLDSAIDRLQVSDDITDGLSELIRRVNKDDSPNTKQYLQSVQNLFGDQNLMDTLFANDETYKYISSQDYQYDMICKYLPRLLDSLEIMRDNVLCSESFSKDFINPKSFKSSKHETEVFNANTENLERTYDLSEFYDKTYMNVSKYGEDFLYIVPYPVAIERLLKRQNYRRNSARIGQLSFYESGSLTCVNEGFVSNKDYKEYIDTVKERYELDKFDDSFAGFEVNLHFNDSGAILDPLNERVVLESKADLDKFRSLSSIHESVVGESSLQKQFEKIKLDNLASSYSDGLIVPDNLDLDSNKIDKDMNGAVLERLPRSNVIPVYIGKKCLGYYYLEFRKDTSACGFCGGHHYAASLNYSSNNYNYNMSEDQQEVAIRYIASKISDSIDVHFINANKDLREEIYSVLRYNDQFDMMRSNDIGVTFIPAEDIVHCYFKFDEDTHRGISDLHKSVIPAMLYILLYLTDIIGKITRSNDKRIYYVKQNVETNVARTMMNVVQQIKKGNMGMRQIESMNNILNVVGKYNDYIIPLGQSGDPPITFEVMNGQDIQTPTEIMEKMEEAAVNATGVPFELVNSTFQQDFAIRFSMSNSRFLKMVYTRQRVTQRFMSIIYTKLYNYEYMENNSLIEIILPPPTYLTMSNNQQLIDNITQLADKIIELEFANEDDEVKTEFKKLYVRSHLSTYLNYNDIDRMFETAKVNVESNKEPAVEEGEGSDEDMMDDEDMY